MNNHRRILLNLFFLLVLSLSGCSMLGVEPDTNEPWGPLDEDAATRIPYSELLPYVQSANSDLPAGFLLDANSRLLALGDSIVQQGKKPGGFTSRVNQAMRRVYPNDGLTYIRNYGVSGYRAKSLMAVFKRAVTNEHPTHVLISVGVNDVQVNAGVLSGETMLESLDVWKRSRSVSDYQQHLRELVREIQATGASPLFMTPTIKREDPESKRNRALRSYADAMIELAREEDAYFIDVHGIFKAYLTKHGGREKSRILTVDGTHMNGLGQKLMAVCLMRLLGMDAADIESLAEDGPATQ